MGRSGAVRGEEEATLMVQYQERVVGWVEVEGVGAQVEKQCARWTNPSE